MKYLFCILALVSMVVPFQVSAQDTTPNHATEPANTWAAFDMTMSYSGLGFTKTQRATLDEGEVIYTTSTTQNGLMFSCLAGSFGVAASLKPKDFRATFSETAGRHKGRYLDMRLDGGEKIGLGLWIYKPTLDAISSRKRSQAAKLYNTVVRRQKVTLHMDSKKPVLLDLPKPNTAFAEFGAECGIGKFAKKK